MADFGEILGEWERMSRRGKRNDRTSESARILNSPAVSREDLESAMLQEPEGYSAIVREDEESFRPLTKAQIAALPVEAVLDLHGQTAAAAESSLSRFFLESARTGLRKVLVIHGKGLHSDDTPVLGKIVRRFLESCPFAGRRGPADKRNGGNGAVWVLIKGDNQRSR